MKAVGLNTWPKSNSSIFQNQAEEEIKKKIAPCYFVGNHRFLSAEKNKNLARPDRNLLESRMLKSKNIFKMVAATSAGGVLEFYDFAIYIFFSPYIALAFFPRHNHLMSLCNTYIVFAVAYLVRPLGGLLLSHFGDRIGRKKIFSLSLLMMGSATLMIGLTPPAQSIGTWSVALLILFRLIQGVSLGGETPGAITYLAESFPKRKGFYCGLLFACMNIGAILGMLIYSLVTRHLSASAMTAWGWRIPFVLGGVVGLLSLYIRRKLPEVVYSEIRFNVPLIALLKHHSKEVLSGLSIASLGIVTAVLFFLYMPVYLSSILSYTKTHVSFYNTLAILTYAMSLTIQTFFAYRR